MPPATVVRIWCFCLAGRRHHTFDELLVAALYRAKDTGRNRTAMGCSSIAAVPEQPQPGADHG